VNHLAGQRDQQGEHGLSHKQKWAPHRMRNEWFLTVGRKENIAETPIAEEIPRLPSPEVKNTPWSEKTRNRGGSGLGKRGLARKSECPGPSQLRGRKGTVRVNVTGKRCDRTKPPPSARTAQQTGQCKIRNSPHGWQEGQITAVTTLKRGEFLKRMSVEEPRKEGRGGGKAETGETAQKGVTGERRHGTALKAKTKVNSHSHSANGTKIRSTKNSCPRPARLARSSGPG